MQWYKAKRTIWLAWGWFLLYVACASGQDAMREDPARAPFFPYRQGAPQVAGVQPGMRVDQNTAQQVAAVLPAEILALVQKGELTFTVQDTTDLPPSEAYIEATLRHYHNVEIEGGELKNYVAGMPFPLIDAHDPQAGEKAVWNFRYRDRGDSEEYWTGVRSLTATGALDRTVSFHGAFLYGLHRPDPSKNIPQWEQEGVYSKQIVEFTSPPDIRGNTRLTSRYDNDHKTDEEWLYDSQVRRVRHPPVYHLAPAFGLYFLVEDYWGFIGYLHPYRWRFIGEQVLLTPGLVKADHVILGGRGSWYPTDPWELRQVYVVEATPFSSHPYTRRVFYIDKQTANVLYILIFDHEGHHWRTIFRVYAHPDSTPRNKGCRIWVSLGFCWVDHLTERAIVAAAEKTLYNQSLSSQLFSLSELMRRGK